MDQLSRDQDQQADLSPLAWVQDELRRSLESVHKTLRRLIRDADVSRTGFDASQPSVPLQQAAAQLHQVVGVLSLVGLPAGATVLRASEATVQRLAQNPLEVDLRHVEAIERADFALMSYVARLLAGTKTSPLSLFPVYRELQQLNGVTRIHPADLWSREWAWQEIPLEEGVLPRSPEAVRAPFEAALLRQMRTPMPSHAANLSNLCAGLAASIKPSHARTLWQLAGAFFEGQALRLLPVDDYMKRLGSRLLHELRSVVQGQPEASERLAHDLLFFCAQAKVAQGGCPRLTAVHEAWRLADEDVGNYDDSSLGRVDPAWVAQAKRRVLAAKESWSAAAEGDAHRLASLDEQFAALGESLTRLFPSGDVLAQTLQRAVVSTLRSGQPPAPALAMEVATSVLYIEAALEDAAFDQADQADRVRRLARRVDAVGHNQPPEPLEDWMEELYRRVSDRQTLGSVVHELRASLSEVERQCDEYFRDPSQRAKLIPVPGQLSAMRGVLSVLGMEQAAQAALHMRDEVDGLANTEIDFHRAGAIGAFERLATNLGALGFLIDMLSVQPHLAKSMFRFDPISGRLEPVMGRREGAVELPDSAASGFDVETLDGGYERASEHALPHVDLADMGLPSLDLAAGPSEPVAAAVAQAPAPAPLAAAPAPNPAAPVVDLVDDPEMLEIFLEEADEVIERARGALAALRESPADLEQLTVVRRAFHTLKGSSRMVGLNDFGEGAWACEQLYNSRLAEMQPAADVSLQAFSHEALDYLAHWRNQIGGAAPGMSVSAPLRASADALRLNGELLPLGAAPDLDVTLEAVPDSSPRAETAPLTEPMPEPQVLVIDEGLAPPLAPEFVLDIEPEAPVAEAPASLPEIELDALDAADAPDVATEAGSLGELDDLRSALHPGAATTAQAFSDTEVIEPMVLTEPTAASEAVTESPLAIDLDLGGASSVGPLTDTDVSAIESLVPPAAPTLPEPELADAEVASYEPEQEAPAEPLPEPLVVAEEIPLEMLAEASADVASEPSLELAAEPEAEAEPQPEPIAAPSPEPEVEEVKHIGPLEISATLFNIFLSEADELSRRLQDGLAEWAAEPGAPLPSGPEAQAHALAGAAATVGYDELSQLARALEHALERGQRAAYFEPEAIGLFLRAAEDVRALLHQFAAGFLKSHDAEIVAALNAFDPPDAAETEAGTVLGLPRDFADDDIQDTTAVPLDEGEATVAGELGMEPEVALLAEVVEPVADVAEPEYDAHDEGDSTVHAALALDEPSPAEASVPTLEPESAAAPEPTAAPAPEPMPDAVSAEAPADDQIDPELYPIFEEEGVDLLAQLHAALRDWLEAPAELSRSDASMRALHTFKGGARLAGAMHLGELAHQLESSVEALLRAGHAGAADVQALQDQADALEHSFEQLGRSLSGAPAAPAPAPTAPVSAFMPAAEPEALAPAPVLAEPAAPEPVAAPAPAPEAPVSERPRYEPAPEEAPAVVREIDWRRWSADETEAPATTESLALAQAQVRVRGALLERMAMQAGEVSIRRARLESELGQIKGALVDLDDNLERIRAQLRELELQAEAQMHIQQELAQSGGREFDPLEFDRYTRFQELTRMLAESVGDVATLQRTLGRSVQTGEDELAAQSRLTRELQDDLLRTRLVSFDSIGERLHRVVRQAARDTGKQVRLDIQGAQTEIDRSVLERMAGPFEHLLRNSVAHGIEAAEARQQAGKEAMGVLRLDVSQQGNEVLLRFSDDGAGLNLERIRQRGEEAGLLQPGADVDAGRLHRLIFEPGFSTASEVTELSGRGVGMDVVRAEVNTLGGSIETDSTPGQGTSFLLRLPLTTALTKIVLLRSGDQVVAVPAALMDSVQRTPVAAVESAYGTGHLAFGADNLPFYWLGGLLGQSGRGQTSGRHAPVVIVRSGQSRLALHVDEVVGNQEVVVKNLGPQLSRVPALAGISLLASGDVALIYNVVALADRYGAEARARIGVDTPVVETVVETVEQAPLIMVVDDSLTVRRVTQRLLERVGYRVKLAKDGLDAMEQLAADELPVVVLSDIEMPRMDGFDLVRNMRADARLAELPVIMITSRIAQKHRDYASQLGVQHYLGKPYDEEQLLGVIAGFARTGLHRRSE